MTAQTPKDVLWLDYGKVEGEIVGFIKGFVKDSGTEGVVVGLSGGIDSSVVGALCVRALGKNRVLGLLLPAEHTPRTDMEDAAELAAKWGIRVHKGSIDSVVSAFLESFPRQSRNKIATANVKARTRMMACYYFANLQNYSVAGTGDRSEDLIGYFTKYGDGGVDFLPIAHLYKTQVRRLGSFLGLPQRVVEKPSSPQLWPGHRATDEIPIDYDQLDLVLHELFDEKTSPKRVSETTGVRRNIVERVLRMHVNSAHKRTYPPMVKPW